MPYSTLDRARKRLLVGSLALMGTALTACQSDAPTAAPSDAPTPNAIATLTTARSYYVDPAIGSDTNPGKLDKPFKTLGRALSVAAARDTVQLAKGRYTSTGGGVVSGDVYPLHVKAGVIILGTLAAPGVQGTFLSPASGADHTTGLVLDGGAKLQNLELDIFGTAIDAHAGTASLRNVSFILDQTSVALRDSAEAVVIKPYMYQAVAGATGFKLTERARLTLDSALVEHDGTCVDSSWAIRAGDSTAVTVKNSTIRNFINGIRLSARAAGTMSNTDVAPAGGLCALKTQVDLANFARLTMTDVRVQVPVGTKQGGEFVHLAGLAMLKATRLTLPRHARGIYAANFSTVELTSSTFEGGYQVVVAEKGAPVIISNSTFTGVAVPLDAYILKMRGSRVYGGEIGIMARGYKVDLGHADDPGMNTFATATHNEVRFAPDWQGQDLYAVGNTWNAIMQGAGPDGRYYITSVSSGSKLAVGENFDLSQPAGTTTPNRIFLH